MFLQILKSLKYIFILITFNNLASFYKSQFKFQKIETIYQWVLKKYKKVYRFEYILIIYIVKKLIDLYLV